MSTALKFPISTCEILIVGPAFSGKGSTGNTILGDDRFAKQPGTKCTTAEKQIYDITLKVSRSDFLICTFHFFFA
jgi:hypothetical protein